MNRSVFLALVLALVAGLWMGSGYIFDSASGPSAPQEATTETQNEDSATIQSVQVMTLTAEETQRRIYVSGRTEASKTTNVSAEVSGQIETLPAEEGALVKDGDIIATIKINDRDVALNSARKRVTQRELEYETAKNLVAKGFSTEVQVATQRAELEAAKAALRRAELDLKNTKIRAPFDGILEERHIEKGDYVTVGDPIAHIIDLSPINVVAYVAEQRIQGVFKGQRAKAALPNGDTYEGTVHFVSRTANDTTRTFRVEIRIENPDLKIADGLTAEVTLFGDTEMAHSISPAILTLSENGDVGVKYIDTNAMDESGKYKVHFQPVIIKSSTANEISVSGLPDPVSVITVGQEFVTTGQYVNYTETKIDALKTEDSQPPLENDQNTGETQ